jgi:hypothetical protein
VRRLIHPRLDRPLPAGLGLGDLLDALTPDCPISQQVTIGYSDTRLSFKRQPVVPAGTMS